MTSSPDAVAESRHSPRLKLPPMYTLARFRPSGSERYCWTGYIYDISSTGMRFELDQDLEEGTYLEVRAMLPGANQVTVHAAGRVVRRHDDAEDHGPVRMGLTFEKFAKQTDRLRLADYLTRAGIRQAA